MMCGYCRPSIGFAGANRDRLQSWAAFLATLTVPWILFADWNMEPEELRSSGWLQTLVTEVDILSPNIEETSTAGGVKLYDYSVCSVTALPALGEFEWLPQGLWSSHRFFLARSSVTTEIRSRATVDPSPAFASGANRPAGSKPLVEGLEVEGTQRGQEGSRVPTATRCGPRKNKAQRRRSLGQLWRVSGVAIPFAIAANHIAGRRNPTGRCCSGGK